ncbi:beta-lactamase family protein [Sphingomonas sp. CGMCC 1.13654]|uniref:Beta-lactamase family protein n=1 Tax=Sphingomonas chungangi TaxID=2683589 RepID=A0A838L363_9SPHN|nr:serine hydrolase domain-containing protein [Sphingomonas chungangi]MBA2933507.1 beta-lactamase family protein [Sphingomonas chungangi]MVW54840.1 serine hydrolase [Sphingomonas chungangi]
MSQPIVDGTVASGFEPVRQALRMIASAEEGLDAQLAIYHRGQQVVDLWTGPSVTPDTLLGVYSVSKGAAHLVAALLVQDGVLDLDERVSHYWPEFGVEGKADLTLRELLAHRSGLVGSYRGFTVDELSDERYVAEQLATQRPYWRPGAAFGYHALLIAALSGEVIRRVTGRTVQELFAERIARPYGIDFHLGLPEALDERFLPSQPPRPTPEQLAALAAAATGPDSIPGIAFNRHAPGNPDVWELPNLPVVRRKGPASFGGVASARALAKMYAAAIGPIDGNGPLLSPETARTFAQVQSIGYDLVTRGHLAFAVGFHATAEYYPLLGEGTFGHSGVGGQQAFADPRHELSFGYVRRRLAVQSAAVEDVGRLIAAAVEAIRGM